MTKSPRKNVPDVGIELGAACMPSELASDRATAPGRSTRQQSRWMSRLQSKIWKPGESIAAFGDDILLMAQKAYANLGSDAQEMLALQQFNKAVPLEIYCLIMDRDFTLISEAVDVVERYEELLNENADRKRAITRATDIL